MVNRVSKTILNQVATFLEALNFSKEEVRVYQTLLKYGPLTKLELSRQSKVNRTKVYRIVENLAKQGVVEEVLEEYSTVVAPTGVDELKRMVEEQQEKLELLNSGMPMIESVFSNIQQIHDKQTKVVFYHGHEGIRQIGWNVLKADKEGVGFTYRQYAEALGEKYVSEWAEEFVSRGLVFRDIYSDEYVKHVKQVGDIRSKSFPNKNFISRYISSDVLSIDHQLDVYNNVVAIYNWYEGEVFGVEIYNEKVACLQKQLFEIVWKIATPEEELASIGR